MLAQVLGGLPALRCSHGYLQETGYSNAKLRVLIKTVPLFVFLLIIISNTFTVLTGFMLLLAPTQPKQKNPITGIYL